MTNFRQIKAKEWENKQRILEVCSDVDEKSGIYIMTRRENGFKYAYIGQAKHLLTRLAQHLRISKTPPHIDLSIKKHGLYSEENPTGWRIAYCHCAEEELNENERELISKYANAGYQLRNKTAGGQDSGKFGIAENRSPKGYRDGVAQGYENARKEIKHLFELHLVATIKSDKPNKIQEKALQKFLDFLNGEQA